ncbi:MAG TPA: VOC family protein [Opitutaceae bacterium]|jgi:PhnB protein
MIVQPYLFFGGRCDEAIEFYRQSVGASVEFLMRYRDSPEPQPPGRLPAGFEGKVMHASVRIGETVLMVSDGCEHGQEYSGFSLSIAFHGEAEARQGFEALSAGGKVSMPLAKTFWSPCFGMLTDRFGIDWMIAVTP